MNRYDAKGYDKGRSGESVTFWVEEVSRIGNLNKASKILDFGCGTGIYTLEFKQNQALSSICDLEPDPQMIRSARSKDDEKMISWCIGVGEISPLNQGFLAVYFHPRSGITLKIKGQLPLNASEY